MLYQYCIDDKKILITFLSRSFAGLVVKNATMRSPIPYVLEPQQHQLDRFYKNLYRAGVPLTVLLILLNEFFLSGGLHQHISTPENLWSLFVLMLNVKMPYEQGLMIRTGLVSFCALSLVVLMKLPKWGLRPVKRGLKSGLPDYEDYGTAYFL